MTLTAIQKILNQAQEQGAHGQIYMAGGSCIAFEFYAGEGYSDPDIISYDTEGDVVGILSTGCRAYTQADSVTHITVFHHKD